MLTRTNYLRPRHLCLERIAFVSCWLACCSGPAMRSEDADFACPEGSTVVRKPTATWCEGGGVKNGRYIAWHSGSGKYQEGRYADGVRVGRWQTWSRDGKLRGESTGPQSESTVAAICTKSSVQAIANIARTIVRDCVAEGVQFSDVTPLSLRPTIWLQVNWLVDEHGVINTTRVVNLGGAELPLVPDCVAHAIDGLAESPPPQPCSANWRLSMRADRLASLARSETGFYPLPEDLPEAASRTAGP